MCLAMLEAIAQLQLRHLFTNIDYIAMSLSVISQWLSSLSIEFVGCDMR